MNKLTTIVITAIIVAGLIIGGYSLLTGKNPVGSVVDSGTYSFKTMSSANASSTASAVIKSGVGTLGSIIVATTHATIVRVYDGTATSTGTLIASFPASAVVGTYTFDIGVKQGIALDIPAGFAGSYVVTYR